MTIGMDTIPGPGTLRKPGVFTEIDNSKAVRGPQPVSYRRLLIGQKLAAGLAAANTLIRITSPTQADIQFGKGSMLAGMVRAAMEVDTYTELQVLPVIDNAAGVAAAATLAFTGPATASGTIELMIAGRRVSVGVISGDAATAIATSVVAAITAADDMPVTATAATGTVTLTSRHKGEAGNSLNARVNYYTGQALPASVAASAQRPCADEDATPSPSVLGKLWSKLSS